MEERSGYLYAAMHIRGAIGNLEYAMKQAEALNLRGQVVDLSDICARLEQMSEMLVKLHDARSKENERGA